jgi:OmpA-OmpF porin, OOP family
MNIVKMSVLGVLVAGLVGGATTACTVKVSTHGHAEAGKKKRADSDKDGIADRDDKCPRKKEDGLAPSATDGCPNLDPDGDKVFGSKDKCPKKAETVNGYKDADGCPDERPKIAAKTPIKIKGNFTRVKLTATTVDIAEKIQFEKNSAEVSPVSSTLLDEVAGVLKKNPDVQVIEIGGHSSAEGAAKHNVDLSQKRVDAVVTELVKRGVPKDRLVSVGYGYHCPTAKGTNAKAHEINRRVEFTIVSRKGKKLGTSRGCKAAKKAGIKIPDPPTPTWNPINVKKQEQ